MSLGVRRGEMSQLELTVLRYGTLVLLRPKPYYLCLSGVTNHGAILLRKSQMALHVTALRMLQIPTCPSRIEQPSCPLWQQGARLNR